MREIGEYLRKVREEKNISLKDVQEATKISMRYLEAIDRGDFNGIPGEVYRKGFIVNYANSIGLDGQAVLQKYNDLKTDQEEQLRLAQVARDEEEKNKAKLNLNWPREVYLTIVSMMIGTLIVVSFFAFTSFNEESAQLANAESNKTDTVELAAPITVYAEFTSKVWVAVKADGEYLFGGAGFIYDSATPQQLWTAQQEMEIETGNAAAMKINFNGKDLGVLGAVGESRTIRLNPKGLIAP